MKPVDYAKNIGPNTEQEVEEIHKGVFDGLVQYWRPDKFVRNLKSFRDEPFEEFEDNDKHYYVYTFVVSYLIKYVALVFSLWALGAIGL
jgi:hypothetical protein